MPGIPQQPANQQDIFEIIDEVLESYWVMYYSQGDNPMPKFIIFRWNNNFKDTLSKVHQFCDATHKHFVRLEPLIRDLVYEEERFLKRQERES